jgi:anti-anti-sigma regulatory factor
MHMLRITETQESGNIIRLRMDGTLNAESFSEVERAWSRGHRSGDHLILLDMAGVDFMTEDAARKLGVLRSERVRVINCSPFVEALLKIFSDIESRNGTP